MVDDDLEFEDLDYPDLDALLDQVRRASVRPEVANRVTGVVEALKRIRFRFEVVEDQVQRLPDVQGKLSILDQLERAQRGVPKCASLRPVAAGTVASWEARIAFELKQWRQLPFEEARDALARLEKLAGAQVDAADAREEQLMFDLE